MGPSGHRIGPPVLQRPGFAKGAVGGGGDHLADLLPPAAVVLRLRHLPRLAHLVEEGQHCGPGRQKGGAQAGQVHQRRVEDAELPVPFEYREPDGQMRKGVRQGPHKAALGLFRPDQRRDATGMAQAGLAPVDGLDVVPFRRAVPALQRMALAVRLHVGLEQRRIGGQRPLLAQRLVGGIAPAGAAIGQNLPDRVLHRVAAQAQQPQLRVRQARAFQRLRLLAQLHPAETVAPVQFYHGAVRRILRRDPQGAGHTRPGLIRQIGKAPRQPLAQVVPDVQTGQKGEPRERGIGGVVQHALIEEQQHRFPRRAIR